MTLALLSHDDSSRDRRPERQRSKTSWSLNKSSIGDQLSAETGESSAREPGRQGKTYPDLQPLKTGEKTQANTAQSNANRQRLRGDSPGRNK